MRMLDSRLFWKFEKRKKAGAGIDFFDFITNTGRIEPRGGRASVRILQGSYLTIGQDALHNIEHDDVILRGLLVDDIKTGTGKTRRKTDEEIIADWMHTAADSLSERKTKEEWGAVLCGRSPIVKPPQIFDSDAARIFGRAVKAGTASALDTGLRR
jgi:hypothetical protein